MEKKVLLERIEWHDLPLAELLISEAVLDLVVTPYSEEIRDYETATLSLSECDTLILDIRGELSRRDRMELEVNRFDYRVGEDGSLSGEIGILPGSAGFWGIKFHNATWNLTIKGAAE